VKALYIHGYKSYPIPQKIEMMENAGLQVTAPEIDFDEGESVYPFLKEIILEEEIDFLVGSSLGGFSAYWLAEELGLPCLLFNPAMSYSDKLEEYIPEFEERLCPARFVVIGALDETVNPKENIRFFNSIDDGECFQRMVICQWLEHQVDFDTFDEMVRWALRSYDNFLKG
jgi:uncharacterized protein